MKRSISMHKQVNDYIEYRRISGFKMQTAELLLLNFAKFIDNKNYRGPITEAIAIEWAQLSRKATRITWARRLEVMRSFAKFCSITEPDTEIPAKTIFGPAHRRLVPYIYQDKEIYQLLNGTRILVPYNSMRSISIKCLFGLLYATGMRVAEALALKPDDVDLNHGLIAIKQTKFNKSRLIPIHGSTIQALRIYCNKRNKCLEVSEICAFFIMDDGSALKYRAVRYAFLRISGMLGWRSDPKAKHPRIYDLRHTFVCNRLILWYRDKVDVLNALPYLSTYLGHVNITSTYWYITGVPQLMNITSKRFEKFKNNKGEIK